MTKFDTVETMKKVNSVVAPSGHETPVAEIFMELARPFCDEVYRDVMGSVIAHKKGPGKKLMFSAHMDSIGFIVTHIDEKGFIRCHNLGGIRAAGVVGTPVKFANGTRGVFLCPSDKTLTDLTRVSEGYIDIGAHSREEALERVQIADVAVYATETYQSGDMIFSPYLDDRIAGIILLKALEELKDEQVENDVYFVFSVQEEVGTRGAMTAAFAIEPYAGVALDVTRTGDELGGKPRMECYVNGGAAIKVVDSSLVCSPVLVSAMKDCAKENKIKWQVEVLEAGGTDAGSIQRSRSGAYAGCISIPTRYIHSPQESCSLSDVEDCAHLAAAFAKKALTF